MQKIDLISTIFTRCGAMCGECSEGILEVCIPINGNFDHFYSGVIDSYDSLLDITYDLESTFDIEFSIEQYGQRRYDEYMKSSSSFMSDNVDDVARSVANEAMQAARKDFREFAHRIEQSMVRLSILLKADDLE